MVVKPFPRKQVPTKNFHQYFLVENFLWLQNHSLENRFLPRIFIENFLVGKFFYDCKIISSKTGSYQKFSSVIFCRTFFIVAKSFPRKQVPTNNFHQKFLVQTFLWSKIISSKTGSYQTFSSKSFWSKNFYGCKIISSKTGSYHKFSSVFFGRKFFMVAKSFPRK
jgi:hypothetical protein